MRDDTTLIADVTLPKLGSRFPAILVRTPYLRVNERIVGWAELFAADGYAFVAQDVRGRGDSDGHFEAWVPEFEDGYDTIEWVASQDWCDGRVGTLGGSYEAWVQWAAAALHPPSLKAMITSGSPGRWFRDWPYRYGAFYAADYFEWLARTSGRLVQPVPFPDWSFVVGHRDPRRLDDDCGLPLSTWQHALDHGTYDDYWRSLEITGYPQMGAAVLQVTGWWDACAPGELHHYRQLKAASVASARHHLVIGPFDHHGAVVSGAVVGGDHDIPASGGIAIEALWAAWFDTFLKNDGAERAGSSPVRYYCLGANTWLESDNWPPTGSTPTDWYLASDGRLTTEAEPQGGHRRYEYDPAHPVVSMTSLQHRERLEWAPRPVLLVENRPDVLCYRSEPASSPVTIAGPVQATLFVSSSAVDTDFVVSFVYVRDDGTGSIVADGILRTAMRAGLDRAEPMEPGTIYELLIEVDDLSLRLGPGEILEVVVSSSLAPNYCPNPNTGEGYAGRAPAVRASQTVFHGGSTASRVTFHTIQEAKK